MIAILRRKRGRVQVRWNTSASHDLGIIRHRDAFGFEASPGRFHSTITDRSTRLFAFAPHGIAYRTIKKGELASRVTAVAYWISFADPESMRKRKLFAFAPGGIAYWTIRKE